uniref:Uncharacterized protein n=1 Tax=Romanomermis culicivorax TaxID=13658 RepID=A0A915JGN4_ROMCU
MPSNTYSRIWEYFERQNDDYPVCKACRQPRCLRSLSPDEDPPPKPPPPEDEPPNPKPTDDELSPPNDEPPNPLTLLPPPNPAPLDQNKLDSYNI